MITPYLELLRETSIERTIRVEKSAAGAWRHYWAEEWDPFVAEARRRDEISDRVEWTRRWSGEFNLIGVVAEGLYGEITGQARSAGFGDGGEDFPGVDVKGTSHFAKPMLLRLATDPLRAERFCLVAVNLKSHTARYVGYATRSELAAAPEREYGYGATRTLTEDQLHKGLQ